MRTTIFAVAFATSLILPGCSFDSIAGSVNPHRIDVMQGNVVDQRMVSQLRRGMTREQVRFVLGTPLVVDAFRQDRWDYVYLFKPGRGEAERRVLSVFFVDDLLDVVQGDVIPASGSETSVVDEPRSRVVEIEAPVGRR